MDNSLTALSSEGQRYSQPIIITVESKRQEDYSQRDPIELFGAIDRAFDFDKMVHPFIDVQGKYEQNSYKTICRDLAGCDSAVTGYYIAFTYIRLISGEWDWMSPDPHCEKGVLFTIKDNDIFGNSSSFPWQALLKQEQAEQNVVMSDQHFYISNRTIIEIYNVPPGAKFEICFFPERVTRVPKIGHLVPGHKKPEIEVIQYSLPQFKPTQ